MKIVFEPYAFEYLSIWEKHDRDCYKILSGNANEKEKLEALKKAALFYRVARNLPVKYDNNLRYGHVLDILENIKTSDFKDTPIDKIIEIESRISQKYGNRSVLSLTTKFLWLKIKQPIIIYDSQARKAIGTKDGKLKEYYDKWRNDFHLVEDEIKKACDRLENLHLYLPNQREGLKKDIKKISNESWFHERVFDIYLWNSGSVQ